VRLGIEQVVRPPVLRLHHGLSVVGQQQTKLLVAGREIIGIDPGQDPEDRAKLRIGGQASVIAYGEGAGILKLLGKIYIRVASWLTYAY